jgi:hypothetical protein
MSFYIYFPYIYLAVCFVISFWPLEYYAVDLFFSRPPIKRTKGAIFVWSSWLKIAVFLFFLLKGCLLWALGNGFLDDTPVIVLLGCLIALLCETYSPCKKERQILALGLGILTGWSVWTTPVSVLLIVLLLILNISALSRSSKDFPARLQRKSEYTKSDSAPAKHTGSAK